jgi:hypothetical protein
MTRRDLVLLLVLTCGLLTSCRQISQTAAANPLLPAPTVTALPAEVVAGIATVVAAQPAQLYKSYPSPDLHWRADVLTGDCVQAGETEEAYEVLQIIRSGEDQPLLIDQQLRNCQGLGAFGLAGLFWSANSRYFYYTNAREGVPDGCGAWWQPIFRWDTQHREATSLGNGARSPDGQWVVTWQSDTLLVWNTANGEQTPIPLQEQSALIASVTWSPDGQSLIYLQVTSQCPLTGPSQAVRVDWPERQQQLLFANQAAVFHGLRWEEPERIQLVDEYNQIWEFEFATKQLLQKSN